MCFPIDFLPASGRPRSVVYQWDEETELLAARLMSRESCATTGEASRTGSAMRSHAASSGSGSVEVEGLDGSWLTFEVNAGRIDSIAVAVWPRVLRRSAMQPPTTAAHVREAVRVDSRGQAIATLEVSASIVARVDESSGVVHLSMSRASRVSERRLRGGAAMQIASDVLLEVDSSGRLAEVWLLNVPPDSIPSVQ